MNGEERVQMVIFRRVKELGGTGCWILGQKNLKIETIDKLTMAQYQTTKCKNRYKKE
jgi:hypothetical protein